MATVVTISVRVNSSQAGAAIDQINAGLAEIGIKGSASIKQAGSEMDKLGGHISTSLDGVRLISQEFGFRMPRALEAMVSRVPGITGAISAMMGAFTTVAVAEILYRTGDAAYKFYEHLTDINSSMREYADTAAKAANTKLFDMASLETSVGLLKEANAQIAQLDAKRELSGGNLPGGGAVQIGKLNPGFDATANAYAGSAGMKPVNNVVFSPADEITRAQAQAQKDAATRRDNLLAREYDLEEQRNKFAAQEQLNPALKGRDDKLIAAMIQQQTKDAQTDLHNETASLRAYQDKYGEQDPTKLAKIAPLPDVTTGQRARQIADEKADEDAQARRAKAAQESADAIMKSQHAALEAGMQGEDLAYQKRKDQIDELTLHLTNMHRAAEIPSAIEEANAKFFTEMDEVSQRTVEAANKASQSVARAQIAAMPEGAARVDAERWRQVGENNVNLFGDDRAAANIAAAQEAANKIQAINKETSDKAAELAARTADLEANYAKQAADAQRHVKSTGLLGWVSDYKDAITAIRAQDNADTVKIQGLLDEQKISWDQFNQAKVNIDAKRDAEILAQNQQMTHQISDTLQRAFTDPIGFIKAQMEKMFFDLLASWITHTQAFKTIFGSMLGSVSSGGAGQQSGIAGALGGLVRGTFSGHPTAPSNTGTGSGGSYDNNGNFIPQLIPASHFANSGASINGSGLPNLTNGLPSSVSPSGLPGWPNLSNGLPGTGGAVPTFPGSTTNVGVPGTNTSMTLGGLAGAGLGGYMAFEDTREAFESRGVKGTLNGVVGDAEAASMIGAAFGPAGALVGGAVGAIGGSIAALIGHVTGEGGNLAAREYYRKTLFPEIEAERNNMGGGNFQTAISQINKSASDGMEYMVQHYGSNAAAWVNANYLRKEQQYALSEIERRAQGGGAYVQRAAAQFHSGGTITGFGDLATSSTEGFIHAMLGEKVANPWASAVHGGTIDAMNGGASSSDIASRYLAASARPSSSGAVAGDTHHHHWAVSAWDGRSVDHYLRNGGARKIVKGINSFGVKYAGDGISG